MDKLGLIAKQEYSKRVRKKSFLIGTLLIPVMFGIIIGVTIFVIDRDRNTTPFGFVDYSGVMSLDTTPNRGKRDSINIIAFPTEEQARTALTEGDIQAFHVIPKDFLNSHKVDLYYWDKYPDTEILNAFDDAVRKNLLPQGPDLCQNRIINGTQLTIVSADGKRSFNQDVGFIAVLFPIVIAMFFFFAVMGTSGYFLQAITDEKENRTMEIMITSLSPFQLISGKSIGLLGVALTQISIWLSSILFIWSIVLKIYPELQGVKLPWDILLVFFVFFFPSFALIGGMMTAIGGIVTELQEGQQISGILNLLFTFPLFLMALVFANPDSPFLVFLSFFPTTSFLTITLRWGFTVIPFWQISLSWMILVVSGAFTVWGASHIFRFGMLQYGQRLSLNAIITSVFPSEIP